MLLSIVAVAGLGWLAVVSGLALAQRRLIYRPPAPRPDPQAAGFPQMRAVRRDGRLLGWWQAPPENQGEEGAVLVFWHGNRGHLARAAAKAEPWCRRHGLGLFAATYAGYEGNPQPPGEALLYRDGRAVLDWLATQGFDASRLVLYGESLGAGVAVQMAAEHPCRALVLEAPFTSIPDLAAGRYPFAPARWLVRERFDNLRKIGGLALPLLILHGDGDRTTPLLHARRLAAAAPGCRLAVIDGAGHIDLYDKGAGAALDAFLAALPAATRGEDGCAVSPD